MTAECDLYLRISLDRTGQELGVDRQEEVCRALCEREGWTIRRVWKDNSKSATKGVRPAFEEMLLSKPKRIVMWSVDRLVRKGPDLERLIELDIPVHSQAAGPMDLATASGRLNARLLTSVATFEGEIKAERQKAAAVQRAAAGKSWWPRRPFGFEMDGSLREDEATALVESYEMLLAGASLSSLARQLNDRGMPTNLGNPWKPASLRPILLNARNAGIRVYDGMEIGEAAWDAIVPEEIYRQAVRLLSDPARASGGGGARVYLMSGIAECGVCGSPVRVTHRGGKERGYATYACRANHCMTHRTGWVDETVLELILLALESPSLSSVWAASGDEVVDIRDDIVKLRAKMLEYEEDRDNDLMSRESFVRLMGKARERLAMLEQDLDQALGTSPVAALAQSKDPRKTWGEGMDLHAQRAVVQSVFQSFRLMPRGRGVSHAGPEHIDFEWKQRASHLRAV